MVTVHAMYNVLTVYKIHTVLITRPGGSSAPLNAKAPVLTFRRIEQYNTLQ